LHSTKHTITFWLLIGFAAVGWFVLFSPWTAGLINFWGGMAVAAGVLTITSLLAGNAERRDAAFPRWSFGEAFEFKITHVWNGLAAAAILYGVFLLGDRISSLLFDFAKPQVAGIYGTKSQASPWVIGSLLMFWIGPAEEIFWRGYVQRKLSQGLGGWTGLIVATLIYTLIHIWSFNFMLIMAALICGVFWALMYKYFRSVWPGIISHAVWDAVIFVVLPIN
jgi:hypothetical protein